MRGWRYVLKSGRALRDAVESADYDDIFESLKDCYRELRNNGFIDEEDYRKWVREIVWISEERDLPFDEDEVDYLLADFYDLCDNLRIFIPLR